MDEFMALIKTIVVLALVIFLANILLKQLNRHITGKNRYIKILERVAVNKNSYIGIVEIAGRYYLMSFSEGRNEILRELDKEELGVALTEEPSEAVFKHYLEMGKKIGQKIFINRDNSSFTNNHDSTDCRG